MIFYSHIFIFVFLPLILLAFFSCSLFKSKSAILGTLILGSLAFYGFYNPQSIIILSASISLNFIIANLVRQNNVPSRKKLLLAIGICLNVVFLAYYKYTNFLFDNINNLLHTNFEIIKIIPPLGISFFTFQQIAYLVDSYRGLTEKSSFAQYFTFVSFFPQILSGPISRDSQLMPQIVNLETFSFRNVGLGIILFSIGLCKKVIFADFCCEIVDPIFNASNTNAILSCSECWEGALAYSLQLYFDFSGYCDMAIGCAKMLSIDLPINFDSPYKSKSITEFWRRWHITLSFFLRDYIYISLGGNRQGTLRKYSNLLLTMLIGGLWHGAAWTFIVWGGMHGLFLVINNIWKDILNYTKVSFIQKTLVYKFFAWCITFLSVTIAWVFFRADNFQSAGNIISGMFSPSLGFGYNKFFDLNCHYLFGYNIGLAFEQFMIIALMLICVFTINSNKILEFINNRFKKNFVFSTFVGLAIFIILLCSVIMLGRESDNSFIYFNF